MPSPPLATSCTPASVLCRVCLHFSNSQLTHTLLSFIATQLILLPVATCSGSDTHHARNKSLFKPAHTRVHTQMIMEGTVQPHIVAFIRVASFFVCFGLGEYVVCGLHVLLYSCPGCVSHTRPLDQSVCLLALKHLASIQAHASPQFRLS